MHRCSYSASHVLPALLVTMGSVGRDVAHMGGWVRFSKSPHPPMAPIGAKNKTAPQEPRPKTVPQEPRMKTAPWESRTKQPTGAKNKNTQGGLRAEKPHG